MTKTNKTIFKIAGILSLISSIFLIVLGMLLIFNVQKVVDIFLETYFGAGQDTALDQVDFYKTITSLNLLFSSGINYYCAKIYLSISKLSKNIIFTNLNFLLILSIAQVFLGITMLPAIFSIIGVILANVNKRKREKQPQKVVDELIKQFKIENAQKPQTHVVGEKMLSEELLKSMAEKINNLKTLKNQGSIDEVDYLRQLNNILEGK